MAIGYNSLAGAVNSVALGAGTNSTGNYSTAIGNNTSATGLNSIAIGGAQSSAAYASGSTSIAIGAAALAQAEYSIALGFSALASGSNTVALGRSAKANNFGEFAYSSGEINGADIAHYSLYVARGQTSGSTPLVVNPDGGSTNKMLLTNDSAWMFTIHIVAREAATDDTAIWVVQGGIKRSSADTTAIIGGSVTATKVAGDAGTSTWGGVSVTADNTLEALQIQVTGEANHTINWVSTVHIAEVGT